MKKKRKNNRKSKKGFTLVELLVSISILGLIMVLAIPSIRNLQDSNRETKYETYADSLITSGKLYTDSYTKDMFGNNVAGCVDIPYSLLKKKNLAKDIKVDNTTCNEKNDADQEITFVRVRKAGDQYTYEVSMKCTRNGTTVYEKKLDGVCNGVDKNGPEITFNKNGTGGWVQKVTDPEEGKVYIVLQDKAGSGFASNITIKYGWTTTKNGTPTSWTTKPFENKGSINLKTLTEVVDVPDTAGEHYLVVEPTYVRDYAGNTTYGNVVSEPFQIDKTGPTIESATLTPTTWTNDKVTITAQAKDEPAGIENIFYTYKSADLESTDYLTDNWSSKTGNGLELIVSGEWTEEMEKDIYVVAEDPAKNKSAITLVGTIKIDKTKPTITGGTVTGSGDSRQITATITDSLSKVTSYAVTTTNSQPAASTFVDVTDTAEYALSYPINQGAATYYIWGKDVAGNVSNAKSVTVSKATYPVTYDANGGSGAPVSQNKVYGETLTLSTTQPTRGDLYKFLGWSTSSTATSADGNYDPGDSYTTNAALKLYAVWEMLDKTPPTCTLSIGSSGITVTHSDTGGSGEAYYGWDSSYSGTNSTTAQTISAKTFTYYVKDNAGNTNSCSITVTTPTGSPTCDGSALTAKYSGPPECNVYNGTYICSYVASTGKCKCSMAGFYTGTPYKYYCCTKTDTYTAASWDADYKVNGYPGCKESWPAILKAGSLTCDSGYTLYGTTWCYKQG